MTLADVDAGLRLCRASRWDQVARDWEHFVTAPNARATAAVRNGRLIGTSASIQYGGSFGWIGMVLVDPEAQGQGLGPLLLKSALDAVGNLPVRLDATPAGHPLYLKQGFTEECRLRRMERTANPAGTEAPLRDNGIRPMTRADFSEIMAMDAGVFGAPRRELLEWMFEGAPDYALVARRHEQLAGYLFGRHGFAFEHLGPIVARESRTAAELTSVCMSRHPNRALIVDATCHDEPWLGFLEQRGFCEQRPLIRMHRGGCAPFGEPQHQFGVLGPEFG